MSLQFKVESLEGIDESLHPLYKESGEYFVLDVAGVDDGDAAGLKRKNEDLLAKNSNLQKQFDEQGKALSGLQKRLEDFERKKHGDDGDVEALNASWQKKLEQRESDLTSQIEGLQNQITRMTVGQTSQRIAAELAVEGAQDLLIPHIAPRLKSEIRNGEAITVVLDGDGKPSALSLDDLKQEIMADPRFSRVIAGSKANGGNAANGRGGEAGAKVVSRKAFDQMNPAQRLDHVQAGGTVTD